MDFLSLYVNFLHGFLNMKLFKFQQTENCGKEWFILKN